VDILGAFGVISTSPATLTAGSTPPAILPPPQRGRLHCFAPGLSRSSPCEGIARVDLPTIVITHGWQSTGSYSDDAPPADIEDLGQAIISRLRPTAANVI